MAALGAVVALLAFTRKEGSADNPLESSTSGAYCLLTLRAVCCLAKINCLCGVCRGKRSLLLLLQTASRQAKVCLCTVEGKRCKSGGIREDLSCMHHQRALSGENMPLTCPFPLLSPPRIPPGYLCYSIIGVVRFAVWYAMLRSAQRCTAYGRLWLAGLAGLRSPGSAGSPDSPGSPRSPLTTLTRFTTLTRLTQPHAGC